MRTFFQKFFTKRHDAASAVSTVPDSARCAELKKQGNVFLAEGNLLEAELLYQAATQVDPGDVFAFVNLGYVLSEQKKHLAAQAALKRALALDAGQIDAHFMLGTLMQKQGDVDSATSHFREVLRLQPDFDLTRFFSSEPEYEQASERYRLIISIDPQNAAVHMSLGVTDLLLGNYASGWSGFQWRFRIRLDAAGRPHKKFVQPLWLGHEYISGKTILLHCEQGYGDTLQFIRYVREVAALGAYVVLQVQPGLTGLLAGLAGVTSLVDERDKLPAFDFHCPLMSLPLALRGNQETMVFGETPYLKVASVAKDLWRQRIEHLGFLARPRIGIAWSGNQAHLRDRQRSIPLNTFMQAVPENFPAVCLQPVVRETDLAALNADARISFLGDELTGFAETAALICALDVVVTVDTSVAHLAGALGKPVWILLPYEPDWRWLLDRSDTPWYASARLFRQESMDDWSGPIEKVRNELRNLANQDDF